MNDEELRALLRQWEAPRAPATLRSRVLPAEPYFWSRWFAVERRRVPWALAWAALLIFTSLWVLRLRTPSGVATLSDFEQVTEFQPRIVRNIP